MENSPPFVLLLGNSAPRRCSAISSNQLGPDSTDHGPALVTQMFRAPLAFSEIYAVWPGGLPPRRLRPAPQRAVWAAPTRVPPPAVLTRSLKARATPAAPVPTFRSTPTPQPCMAGDENTAGLTVGTWGERGQGAMSLPLAAAVSVCGPRPHPVLAAAPPSTHSPWTGGGRGAGGEVPSRSA